MVEATRKGWVRTASGRKIDIFNPDPKSIVVEDIAHSLSRLCRFNGHLNVGLYSVAQHSVIVSHLVNPRYALEGLMHDAAESITGDIVRPVKIWLTGFGEIEEHIEKVLAKRFKLSRSQRCLKEVKRADNVALVTEARDLLNYEDSLSDYSPDVEPDDKKIVALSQLDSYKLFMRRYWDLTHSF